MTAGNVPPSRPDWLTAIRRYLLVVTAANLMWETAQAPLYTLWRMATPLEIVQAIVHCTLGDLVIATAALIAALALVGSPAWPDRRAGALIATVVIGTTGYTIYSEYVNVVVKQSWAYTEWMPRLPWLGTGLSPLAQWLIVPAVALFWAGRAVSARDQRLPQKSPRSAI